jgi:hypothetical protein
MGQPLAASDINNMIELLIGDDVPLHAYHEDGRIFVTDGASEPVLVEDLPKMGLVELFYDWAVYAGYTIEAFEDFYGGD